MNDSQVNQTLSPLLATGYPGNFTGLAENATISRNFSSAAGNATLGAAAPSPRSPDVPLLPVGSVLSVFFLLLVLLFFLFAALARRFIGVGGGSQAARARKLVTTGNGFKLSKSWLQAARAFETAADTFQYQIQCEHDTANNFAEAANCYRKVKQPEFTLKAVQCLETAARIYAEAGQFSIAARHLEEAGDLIAKSNGIDNSSSEAIRLYQKAADYWDDEDSPAGAADSRSKAAHVMGDTNNNEMLLKAAKKFEDLGVSSQRHALLAFGAKDYMLKACLSQLCVDPSSCPELADDLAEKCTSFAESDERTLVMKLSAACVAGDAVVFDNAVTEFERFNNLDDWSRRRLAILRDGIVKESPDLI